MKKPEATAGLGAPAIIGIIAVLAIGGIATGHFLSGEKEMMEKDKELAATSETDPASEAPAADLPDNDASNESGDTMMADDPKLETMDDTANDNGTSPTTNGTSDVEVMEDKMVDSVVETTAVDPLPLASGTYEDYSPEKLALAETGDVVLFFHAPWCPSCRGLENDINSDLSAIPDGVHILVIDYDSETALKQQYGVVRQHTLVQVNSNGDEIKKLTGLTNTLDQVVGQL